MSKEKQGFTLAEVLVVVVIISSLALLALPRYGDIAESARRAEAYSVLSEIAAAEHRYYTDDERAAPKYTGIVKELDIFSASPNSENFNFTVESPGLPSGYALATKKANRGKYDYWVCLGSGKRGADAASCP